MIKVVPLPACDSTQKFPPTETARSCMIFIPQPELGDQGVASRALDSDPIICDDQTQCIVRSFGAI